MGSNRKRPFGYKMEFGEIVLHPAEAETVRWIYDSYLAGASYNALVDKLRERGIPYDGDKPGTRTWRPVSWRIAATPARVDSRPSSKGAVPNGAGTTQERTTPCQKGPAQKELRKLCRGSPPDWVERQVLGS